MTIRLERDPEAEETLSLSIGDGLEWVTDTFDGGPEEPAADNGIEITITRAQSLAMNDEKPFSGGYYDLLVDNPDGTTTLLMAGQFDLLPTVTR
jgi:hypothetical protein